ncbi:hypothetical protein WG66_008018 [Moniliophthora roreri]|nr:hypothetical protein WG66_008018 [Moniliophthora roreri]
MSSVVLRTGDIDFLLARDYTVTWFSVRGLFSILLEACRLVKGNHQPDSCLTPEVNSSGQQDVILWSTRRNQLSYALQDFG